MILAPRLCKFLGVSEDTEVSVQTRNDLDVLYEASLSPFAEVLVQETDQAILEHVKGRRAYDAQELYHLSKTQEIFYFLARRVFDRDTGPPVEQDETTEA